MLTQQTEFAKEAAGDLPKKNPTILIFAVITLIAVAAGILYFQLSKSALTDEQKRLKDDIRSLQAEVVNLESQKIEATQVAQMWLAQIQKNEIRWSNVLDKINGLMPVDSLGQGKFNFNSYSGSEAGKLTLNGKTVPSKVEPFPDLADLLATFNSSSFFSNAYIPTISRGESDTGEKILSFVFNMNYKEKTPDEISGQSMGSDVAIQHPVKIKVPVNTAH